MYVDNSHIVLAKACIPTNNLLSGPLTKPISDLEGALGGLLFGIVILIFLALVVAAVLMIVSKKGAQLLRAALLVLVVPLGAIVAIMIWTALLLILNNAC